MSKPQHRPRPQYYIRPAEAGSNSWNVFERNRLNVFGERYCVACCVTFEQARAWII